MTDDQLTEEAWDAKYKRERREEMELAVRMNLEANAQARDEAIAADQAIYDVRHAQEAAEQDARIDRIDANERARDERSEARTTARREEDEARYDAKTTERDRRVTWWCAVGGAAANPNCPDAVLAAEFADAVLAEYDKRWPSEMPA